MEVTLNAIIISAWEHNHPLTCGEVMQAANSLIKGTPFAAEIIRQRKAHNIYKKDDPPLLGCGWWRGYRKRNADIVESKVGQKFTYMQAQNCTYHSLLKSYNTFQHGLVESGNAEPA